MFYLLSAQDKVIGDSTSKAFATSGTCGASTTDESAAVGLDRYTFRANSERFPGVDVAVVPASPPVRRRIWEGRVKCGKDVSFSSNDARK